MERGTVSPPGKKWTKAEVISLFQKGTPYEEIKKITGLPPKVLAGYKGYLKSPFYEGPPLPDDDKFVRGQSGSGGRGMEAKDGSDSSEHNGHDKIEGLTQELEPQLIAEVGPTEAQALASIVGKPYLINVKNVYVSPDALKCYQYLVAKGFKGSVGEFFELCVLKIFKERYGVVPGMIMPPAALPQ